MNLTIVSNSLSGTLLRLRLSGALKKTQHGSVSKINDNVVYTHPTINALTALVCGESESQVTIEDLIAKYSTGLGSSLAAERPNTVTLPAEQIVLITGTTGNLGAELLLRLLEDPKVKTVYALNRKSSSALPQQRHEDRFKDRGFDISLLSSSKKLVYLEGEASQERLGLDLETFEKVRICGILACNVFIDSFYIIASVFSHDNHSQRMASRLQPLPHILRIPRTRDKTPHRPCTVNFSRRCYKVHFCQLSSHSAELGSQQAR